MGTPLNVPDRVYLVKSVEQVLYNRQIVQIDILDTGLNTPIAHVTSALHTLCIVRSLREWMKSGIVLSVAVERRPILVCDSKGGEVLFDSSRYNHKDRNAVKTALSTLDLREREWTNLHNIVY